MSELLTVKEVAEVLKVNPDKVYDLIKKGHLQALKLGRMKIPKWAIDEFIKRNIGMDLTDLENIKQIDKVQCLNSEI